MLSCPMSDALAENTLMLFLAFPSARFDRRAVQGTLYRYNKSYVDGTKCLIICIMVHPTPNLEMWLVISEGLMR